MTYSNQLAWAAGVTLALGTSVNAAVITYAGSQLNVDAKQTTLPTTPDSVGWRNATPAKPLDIDGDNVIGTDGYYMRGDNSAGVRPGYITGFTNISGGGNNFGYADDPTDPTGIDDFRTGFWGSTSATKDLFSFVIQGTALEGKTLGVAVQFDTYNSLGKQIYTLAQTVGGTASVTTPELAITNDGYDWAFFYITGAVAGDTFKLTADKPSTGATGYLQWGGVAFDSAVPEPVSLAVLGLGGLMLRRRRD